MDSNATIPFFQGRKMHRSSQILMVNITLSRFLVVYRWQPFRIIGFTTLANINVTFTEQRKDHCMDDMQVRGPLHRLYLMEEQGIATNPNEYGYLLQGCVEMKIPTKGKSLHAHFIKKGMKTTVFLENHLINMYAKGGSIEYARQVFDKMSQRNVFSWNTMIAGYINYGSVEYARHLFDKMLHRDVVSWNTIIAGYALKGQGEEAFKLFSKMQHDGIEPDRFTFSSVISASVNLSDIQQGKQVHAHIIQAGFDSHVTVNNALITMYFKYESSEDAYQVFSEMPLKDGVSWNAIIVGYAQHRQGEKALEFFEQMIGVGMKPDNYTLASVLSAYANLEALDQGRQFHAHVITTGFELNAIVGSALVDMYSKSGSRDDARRVFDRLPERDAIVWNTMISGYSQSDYCDEALKLFTQMLRGGLKPDECSFVCVLSACAGLAARDQGKQIHGVIIRTEFASYVSVGNALVTLYAKCGSIEEARHMFNKMPKQDSVTCNAMIAGYAQHGCGMKALQLFEEMLKAGIKPNPVTFISVLSACSHAGLVDEGRYYFESMNRDHSITPSKDHYSCMIDILGRAGYLEEAEKFIQNMPFEPDAIGWAALLGACRSQGNIELGSRVAEQLFKLEPANAAPYVVLANMYASAGRWNDVSRVRKMMKDRGVKKQPGCSWIDINKRVHAFVAEDSSHPQMDEIYATLETLAIRMKEAGYVPDTKFALLHDVGEEYKKDVLSHHSEKLALAFGLMNTPSGTTIQIIKNLRVCGDCHTAFKFISMITEREIIVRDANRFHHFKNARCSCGDYW